MRGGWGYDTAHGGLGDDTVAGGRGNDTVIGCDGEDVLLGDRLSDAALDPGGADLLLGRLGDDLLLGGGGGDTLHGGLGNDVLAGGTGADLFQFHAADDRGATDHVLDFSVAEGDALDLVAPRRATVTYATVDLALDAVLAGRRAVDLENDPAAQDTMITVAGEGWTYTLYLVDTVLSVPAVAGSADLLGG